MRLQFRTGTRIRHLLKIPEGLGKKPPLFFIQTLSRTTVPVQQTIDGSRDIHFKNRMLSDPHLSVVLLSGRDLTCNHYAMKHKMASYLYIHDT
jgi:hypothetical protein